MQRTVQRGGVRICRNRSHSLNLVHHRTRVRFPRLMPCHFSEPKFIRQLRLGALADPCEAWRECPVDSTFARRRFETLELGPRDSVCNEMPGSL